MFENIKKNIRHDLLASLVVFLVALPLCMGVAIASGVPPAMGLITGVVGGLIVGSIAGAPLQVSGPAAGLTVIVYQFIQQHGLEMLGPVLVLAGAIQLVAGLGRVGQWFRAISPAVIEGMLAGIGILILASQFHVMVDDKPRASGLKNLLSIPESIVKGITPDQGTPHQEAAAIGLLTIVTLVLWSKFAPKRLKLLPGALIGAALASVVAAFFKLPIAYVHVPENLLGSIKLPGAEQWGALLSGDILLSAFAIAFVASAETLLSASAVDRMQTRVKTNYDRELAAQGVGNLVCGMLGALPMTGVIVRSSANVQAGAQSRMSTMIHGGWLLMAIFLLPAVLRNIPVSCLAAILVYIGYKLVDPKHIRHLRGFGLAPVGIYVATVVAIVTVDLLTGVLVGIALSTLKLIYKVTRLEARLECAGDRADLFLEGTATFIKLPKLAAMLDKVPAQTALYIHADRLVYIDHSCLDLLQGWEAQRRPTGVQTIVHWEGLNSRYLRPMQMTPALEPELVSK